MHELWRIFIEKKKLCENKDKIKIQEEIQSGDYSSYSSFKFFKIFLLPKNKSDVFYIF